MARCTLQIAFALVFSREIAGSALDVLVLVRYDIGTAHRSALVH